jgi:menaquinol-cytochrome c reductase iron-sulfur subunit
VSESNGTSASTDAMSKPDKGDMTRGQFLTAASIGVGGLMGAMIAAPVAGMALSPAVKGTEFEAVPMGDIATFEKQPDTYVKVTLEPGKDEYGAYVRRRVAFVRYNKSGKDEIADKVMWKGDSQGKFSVVSNICAHLGCPVQQSGTGFVCPCHGGAYDNVGQRTAGPPARALDRFMWEVRGDKLWAVGHYSVSLDGEKQTFHGPGQHAGNLMGKLFYPVQPSS